MLVEAGVHVGVGPQHVAEGRRCSQAIMAVPLDDAVGLVAGEARLHQGEQHRLAEHEAVGGVEVLQHPLGEHLEPLDDRRELAQHVVGQQRRVGQDDPLDRRVGDVRARATGRRSPGRHRGCPRRTRARPAEPLALHRVALVGHGRRPFWPALRNGSSASPHLGALQVADLGGERLDRGPHRRRRRRAYSAWRSRASTWVAGTGVRPERARTRSPRRRGRRWSRCPPRPTACRRPWRRGPGEPLPVPVAPGGPTAPAWRPRWSARRGCRGCGPPWRVPQLEGPGGDGAPRVRRRRRSGDRRRGSG